MTIEECRAWLDGYVAGSGRLPSTDKLMEKLSEVHEPSPEPLQWWFVPTWTKDIASS